MSGVRVTHSPMSRVMALYTNSSGVQVSHSAMRGLGVTCSPVISVGVILLLLFNNSVYVSGNSTCKVLQEKE